MLDTLGITGCQIAAELGGGADELGCWRWELRQRPQKAFSVSLRRTLFMSGSGMMSVEVMHPKM
jgi:hypothetical protein